MKGSDIATILARHPRGRRDALIGVLQEVQPARGCLSPEVVVEVGRHLDLPASKVYGVATFYNQFRFVRAGRFRVQVCRGTACHVKGSKKVLDAVRRALGIEPGQTTGDGLFSLDAESMAPSPADTPFGQRSTAGKLFGATGGVMEAAIRTAHYLLTGRELAKLEVRAMRGLGGVKQAELAINGQELRVAAVSALANARRRWWSPTRRPSSRSPRRYPRTCR